MRILLWLYSLPFEKGSAQKSSRFNWGTIQFSWCKSYLYYLQIDIERNESIMYIYSKSLKIIKRFIVEDYEGSKILFNEDNQDINILNKVAWEVFSLLDGDHSIEDIFVILHNKYVDQNLEDIKSDVNDILLKFESLGFFDDPSHQGNKE